MSLKKNDILRTSSHNEVIFPIFEECKEWTLDPYWVDIFDKCANGELPSGVKITSTHIIAKDITYKILSDSLENFQNILKIFEKIGLGEKEEERPTIYYDDWKSIRSKKTKYQLLLKYVIECEKKYELSITVTKKLLAFIQLAFLLKQLTSSNIFMDNGKIKNIEGIDFKKNDFIVDVKEFDEKVSESVSTDKVGVSVERYIKEFKNSLVN